MEQLDYYLQYNDYYLKSSIAGNLFPANLLLAAVGVEGIRLLIGHHFDVVDVDMRRQGHDPFDHSGDVVAGQRRNAIVNRSGSLRIAVETYGGEFGIDHSGPHLAHFDPMPEEIDAHAL